MNNATSAIEDVVWAAAYGTATPEQLETLKDRPVLVRDALNRLIDLTEDALESAHDLPMSIRQQVVTDFEDDLERLVTMFELVGNDAGVAGEAVDPIGQVRLQVSWHGGKVIVWAAGPTTQPDSLDGLKQRLEDVGCPTAGWTEHQPVALPSGIKAPALSNSVSAALGWLVAVGGGQGRDAVGTSVAWMGRVAVDAVRVVAEGNIVPSLDINKINDGKALECKVQWMPALLAGTDVDQLAAAMPGPVTALGRMEARRVTLDLLRSVVDAIVTTAARQTELPAPPPQTRSTSQVAEAVMTRLNGTTFETPVAAGAEISKRLQRWAKPATGANRPTLVIQLDPPDRGDAWFLQVMGKGAEGNYLPIEVALADSKNTKPLADELHRVERVLPALMRPGGKRRGQVYLSQEEAWELMTVTGPALEKCGFQVRVPKLSKKKPSPQLRLFAEAFGQESVVGAHQLANVRWSAVFGDVELTAEDIQKLVHEAKPLVKSHGQWVELDRADLREAAAALAERADKTQMNGAELLRHAVGLEDNPLSGGIDIAGTNWATDILRSAQESTTEAVTQPEGFRGELRHYQAEAVGWLGFLDNAGLSGCLALDMGLGKTPTVLAHIARTKGNGPALVVAPPAVVGNWAAEARKFTPGLQVYVHHGTNREEGTGLERRISRADLVISTYGTAVRDVDALEKIEWSRVVLDEAQAIKNPANETSQQLRRIPSKSRVALTGTPIENGLGDLWAILDYCNPGLVGTRPAFIAQMSGESDAALQALNGILVFRRTKTEPGVAEELPDRIDELDHCAMTPEQIGLYQAVIDSLTAPKEAGEEIKQGAILAAITALKQICNHPANYQPDDKPLEGRSGKLTRLEEIIDHVFEADEKILIFTHFASWGRTLAEYLTKKFGVKINSYDGSLARGARDKIIEDFQNTEGKGALVLSLKAGGTGLNLTAASHVVLYDRWWNPAVEDQARDRAWRIGQTKTVVSHRLVCPGTVDERVEEVVAGKRHIANLVLPKSSSLSDLDASQLRVALGLSEDELLTDDELIEAEVA